MTTAPMWSVMIPTHNCAPFLRLALRSVLAQAPGPDQMQICVVDDHSTVDDPAAVVAESGGRVEFLRQPSNVGHTRNFNTCLELARGTIVHLLHGDDVIGENFYESMLPLLDDAKIGAVFCRQMSIDEEGVPVAASRILRPTPGILDDAMLVIAADPIFCSAAVVVRRRIYQQVGGFDTSLRWCGEDLEMWLRIAARHPIAYVPGAVAMHRVHRSSLISRAISTGENLKDLGRAIDIADRYVPEEVARRARITAAVWGAGLARRLAAEGRFGAAGTQLREALNLSRAPRVVAAAARAVVTGSLSALLRATRRARGR